MEEGIKFCPLRKNDCIKEFCALWYRRNNSCAILSIAESLKDGDV